MTSHGSPNLENTLNLEIVCLGLEKVKIEAQFDFEEEKIEDLTIDI